MYLWGLKSVSIAVACLSMLLGSTLAFPGPINERQGELTDSAETATGGRGVPTKVEALRAPALGIMLSRSPNDRDAESFALAFRHEGYPYTPKSSDGRPGKAGVAADTTTAPAESQFREMMGWVEQTCRDRPGDCRHLSVVVVVPSLYRLLGAEERRREFSYVARYARQLRAVFQEVTLGGGGRGLAEKPGDLPHQLIVSPSFGPDSNTDLVLDSPSRVLFAWKAADDWMSWDAMDSILKNMEMGKNI